MEEYIIKLIEKAEEVTMPDNTRGKAIQCQVMLITKELAGALSRIPNGEMVKPSSGGQLEPDYYRGVFRMLTVGQTADKKQVLVESIIRAESILSLSTVAEAPRIQATPSIIRP